MSVTFPIAPPGLLIKGVLQEDTNEAKKNIEAGKAVCPPQSSYGGREIGNHKAEGADHLFHLAIKQRVVFLPTDELDRHAAGGFRPLQPPPPALELGADAVPHRHRDLEKPLWAPRAAYNQSFRRSHCRATATAAVLAADLLLQCWQRSVEALNGGSLQRRCHLLVRKAIGEVMDGQSGNDFVDQCA